MTLVAPRPIDLSRRLAGHFESGGVACTVVRTPQAVRQSDVPGQRHVIALPDPCDPGSAAEQVAEHAVEQVMCFAETTQAVI
ncbi:hypothetical protein ACIBL6_19935 [Streptomyces sp. NPDC050400]|uniref:hypothetical protein n=1 Tax=Streptomyces sp. NPDC050400 TaxID=3365610 RepID=UPI003788CE97